MIYAMFELVNNFQINTESYIPDSKIIFFIMILLIFAVSLKTFLFNKSLPPGPWGIPFLGYLPFVFKKAPHTLYLGLSDRYGDIFSIKLGTDLVVGIGTAKLMRDLFNRGDSTGRPKTPLNALLGGLGIVTSQGSLWKRQRTFLHEKLRALGVRLHPNELFEKYVIAEVEELLGILDEAKGEPVNPHMIFGRHVHNVICQLLMSFRFKSDDKEFTVFNERVSRGMKLFGMIHTGEHFKPFLYLPGKQAVIKEIKRNLLDLSKFHGKHLIKRTKERLELGGNTEPADLLDCYLDRLENQDKGSDSKAQIFPGVEPDKQIIQVMNDLFSAGLETALSTLLWCIVMMVREPDTAKKVREELKRTVAPGQRVGMEHRSSMPYLEAFIFETMRLLSIVPLGTVHVNEVDWKVEGHIIPAGTHIVPLINKINMDPKMYPEPSKFKPERFIKDGKCHTANFLQFGVGQRMCVGNLLARMELFLFLANILNTFELSVPEGYPLPGLYGVFGATHSPLPYKLCFIKLEQ